MTADKFHDAITLLPVDLVAQVDQKRMAPRPKNLRLQRYAAMAASLAIILCSGLWCLTRLNPREEAAVCDFAMAPMSLERSETAMAGAAGDISVSAVVEGTDYPLTQEEAYQVWELLTSLSYDANALCNCIAPITLTVNSIDTYALNLEEGYIRSNVGQASLTTEQRNLLLEIFSGK